MWSISLFLHWEQSMVHVAQGMLVCDCAMPAELCSSYPPHSIICSAGQLQQLDMCLCVKKHSFVCVSCSDRIICVDCISYADCMGCVDCIN